MGWYVRRLRIRDTSAEHELGHPSKVGQVRYTKTFRTLVAAQREANAWASLGDYDVSVHEGRSPKQTRKE